MQRVHRSTSSEHGGTRFNLLAILTLLGLAAYSGLQYIPVAYEAFTFKDFMQQQVDVAAATGKSPEWVKGNLMKHIHDYNIPEEVTITTEQGENGVSARVVFTRPVNLPGYVYQYEFDHTATSSSLFTK
jgi:hypothetical protein